MNVIKNVTKKHEPLVLFTIANKSCILQDYIYSLTVACLQNIMQASVLQHNLTHLKESLYFI